MPTPPTPPTSPAPAPAAPPSPSASSPAPASARPALGLRANAAQFGLLMLVNAFVGAMVGMERSILPALAQDVFDMVAHAAILSFIAVFGVTKAITNYGAGRFAERYGRRPVLIAGWLLAVPVPFLLMWAPSWNWVLAANVLLGVSQGLTWSTTVIMKIDLAGPKNRGFAMGLNEFAGYAAVGLSALATGYVASTYGLRPAPFALGVGYVVLGTLLSVFAVRETQGHAAQEEAQGEAQAQREAHEAQRGASRPQSQARATTPALSAAEIVRRTSLTDPALSAVSQAGLVNNLNDGMAWGLFPLVYAHAGLSLADIGVLAAIYPAVWGIGQLFTGAWSDRTGRKPFIVAGMVLQAVAIALIAAGAALWPHFAVFAAASALLGLGTAMVYPTLLAAIGDRAAPAWRASAVGVYRLWRDMGYAVGAVLAGVLSDAFGLDAAVLGTAALTLASGLLVAARMPRAC